MKLKETKNTGITLIALIITIIVLLILAGVTIAALTGSDSAPVKANESSQKNDIGSAKDDVALTATNAITEAYNVAYVENGVAAGDASTTVGTIVRNKLNQKYGTDGHFQTGLATITATTTGEIEISTTDFVVEGKIAEKGGILTWGEIEANVPRISDVPKTLNLDTNSIYTINAKLKGITGDITWTSSDSSIASVLNGKITTALSIAKPTEQVTITASATGCESKTCILTVTKTMPYAKDALVLTNSFSPYVKYKDKNNNTITCRVLYNDETHGLQIITNDKVQDVELGCQDPIYKDEENATRLTIARKSYDNALSNLNSYSENYLNTNLAYDARCVGSQALVNNNVFINKNVENTGSDGYMAGDTNYEEDYNTMNTLNITYWKNYFGYWLASRIAGMNDNRILYT